MNFVDAVAADRVRREVSSDTIHNLAAERIMRVLKQHAGEPQIAVWLALGEACRFQRWWEKEIWLAEIARLYGGAE